MFIGEVAFALKILHNIYLIRFYGIYWFCLGYQSKFSALADIRPSNTKFLCCFEPLFFFIFLEVSKTYSMYMDMKVRLSKYMKKLRKKLHIPVVSTYLFGSGRYLRWMESPSIMLSGCDWTPGNLNLFNKF